MLHCTQALVKTQSFGLLMRARRWHATVISLWVVAAMAALRFFLDLNLRFPAVPSRESSQGVRVFTGQQAVADRDAQDGALWGKARYSLLL